MVEPVTPSLLQVALAFLTLLLFAGAVLEKRIHSQRSREAGSVRSRLSIVGIVIQTLAFFIVSVGRVSPTASALSPLSIVQALIVLCAGLGAVLLFRASARALGDNWSLVARTRAEHSLVRHGPFARLRHPIYFAILLMLIAIGVGFGHPLALIPAIPLYLVGTAVRVREEEKLLIGQFGDDYRAYARETPAFIPRLP